MSTQVALCHPNFANFVISSARELIFSPETSNGLWLKKKTQNHTFVHPGSTVRSYINPGCTFAPNFATFAIYLARVMKILKKPCIGLQRRQIIFFCHLCPLRLHCATPILLTLSFLELEGSNFHQRLQMASDWKMWHKIILMSTQEALYAHITTLDALCTQFWYLCHLLS